MISKILPYAKAVVAFFVTYVASLLALVTVNTEVTPKILLLALGTAIVTTYGVYQTPNKVVK